MNTDKPTKHPAKPTDRKYSSVEDLLRGEGISRETQEQVAQLEKETRVTRQLASMRTAAGITQEQMAARLECTQGCISKWESGSDEDLTLKIIKEYCRATDQ